ncbi:MAG TPA: NAD(P)(+) transhydrogenase (Re/Si-specific) subunit beta, partial [Acidimicrobiia bacterium]|nr:NAD(P)(+) transhydrogenase (Re/Si-specific) subunit beta [Acidimicrobiia bacterium]
MNREVVSQLAYLAASILFILGLRGLTKPDKARRGMMLAAIGMLIAIIGTLVKAEIISYGWILVGLVLGSLIGYPLGVWVPMTAMP